MDSIGSEAVEKAADWLENEIRDMAAANGNKVGWRYSLGYCDWDITQQKELFRFLDGKTNCPTQREEFVPWLRKG